MADITFISASIGGGKSLFATRAACEEMARSERFVVTNLPIYTEASEGILTFQEWCQKYVEKPVDTLKRFRLLTREEVFEFWRYLPNGVKLPEIERSRPDGSTELVTNLDVRNRDSGHWFSGIGCFYIIDEVHLFFSARDWTKIGNRVEFYMSQLRKLNDDLFLISQHPEKVDKNFRRNATEWIYLQNMGKARLWLGVSLPRRFRFHTYLQMPLRNDKPVNSGWMKLEDREYHKVYNTMSGVGLSGRLLPEDSRKKGRHWIVYVFALLLVGIAAWFLPRVFTYLTGHAVGGMVNSFSNGISKGLGLAPKTNSVANNGVIPITPPAAWLAHGEPDMRTRNSRPVSDDYAELAPVYMSGMAKVNGEWQVWLTDGRRLSSKDVGMDLLTSEGVKYEGKWYRLAHAMVDREKSARNFGREEIAHDAAKSSPIVYSAPPFNAVPAPDTRMRQMRIHFQDGSTITKEYCPSEATDPDVDCDRRIADERRWDSCSLIDCSGIAVRPAC